MKRKVYLILGLVIAVFLSGCAQQEVEIQPSVPEEIVEDSEQAVQGSNAEIQQQVRQYKNILDRCSGEKECLALCEIYRGECEKYCRDHENELCKIIFPPKDSIENSQPSYEGCIGTGAVQFISPPMRLEDIGFILPIGLMIGGHVTPIDHGYYYSKNWRPSEGREDPSKFKDVLAPADGVLRGIGRMPQQFTSSSIGDYRLTIDHSCTFYTIYIHINQISPKLQAAVDRHTNERISVKAGELLGKAPGFDFSVHDEEVILPGFIVPEHYNEPWKIHTVDMFAYFVEPIKSQLLAKNVRQKEPRGGKIDYDIDGKLVGNWFLEGTNGYAGGGHLAFSYDGIDPSLLIVSIGDFKGGASNLQSKEIHQIQQM
ncbi:MAG: hypothetical protein Q8R04_01890 [Nanoarchaeota archaeon]|nr:hypothetical protein [Nanoarchaeota archaeon]